MKWRARFCKHISSIISFYKKSMKWFDYAHHKYRGGGGLGVANHAARRPRDDADVRGKGNVLYWAYG